MKNTTERVIVPYNSSGNSLINKEQYSLFAPIAQRGRPGMAAFDTSDFDIKEQTVILSSNVKNKLNTALPRFKDKNIIPRVYTYDPTIDITGVEGDPTIAYNIGTPLGKEGYKAPGAIPVYENITDLDGNAILITGDPSQPLHVVNKRSLDSAIANKMQWKGTFEHIEDLVKQPASKGDVYTVTYSVSKDVDGSETGNESAWLYVGDDFGYAGWVCLSGFIDFAKIKSFASDAKVSKFTIDHKYTSEGTPIFGTYVFNITLGNGDVFSKELDLPLEAVQIASVDDYIDDNTETRYLKISFVDANIAPLVVELDEIFNLDVFKKYFVERLKSSSGESSYTCDADGTTHVRRVAEEVLPNSIVKRDGDGNIIVGNSSNPNAAVSKRYVDTLTPFDVSASTSFGGEGYVEIVLEGFKSYEANVFSIITDVYEDDMVRMSNVYMIYTDGNPSVYVSTQSISPPAYFMYDDADRLHLYCSSVPTSSFDVYVKGMSKRCTAVTLNTVDELHSYVSNVIVTSIRSSDVTSYPTGRRIVQRDNNGDVLLRTGSNITYASNAALPKSYIDKMYSSKISTDFLEDKVQVLEGNLLEYITYSDESDSSFAPSGVGAQAILHSVSGLVHAIEGNMFNPTDYGLSLNEDGSFTVSGDNGEGGYSGFVYANIELPSGTYYMSVTSKGSLNDNHVAAIIRVNDSDVDPSEPIVLSGSSDVYIELAVDGIGDYDIDVYVMLSSTPGSDFVPYYEPLSCIAYESGSRIIDIPVKVQALARKAKNSCTINFTDKTITVDKVVTDISAELSTYSGYLLFDARQNDAVRFLQEDYYSAMAKYTIYYVKPRR